MTQVPDNSVHCCVCSPPYWSQRLYHDVPDLVWFDKLNINGPADGCRHEWGSENIKQLKISNGTGGSTLTGGHDSWGERGGKMLSQFCLLCGAWKGSLGAEPSPELYLQHLMQVMTEIKRVLRPDGIAWINLDDSMAGSWGNYGARNGEQRIQTTDRISRRAWDENTDRPGTTNPHPFIKPLDLCLIPQRFVDLCQRDGWYVRSEIIWYKHSAMPESVRGVRWERHRVKIKGRGKSKAGIDTTELQGRGNPHAERDGYETEYADCPGCPQCLPNGGLVLRQGSWRPTSAHEYIFLLTKSAKYWADGEAVREAHSRDWSNEKPSSYLAPGNSLTVEAGIPTGHIRQEKPPQMNPAGRNLRSVWEINPGGNVTTLRSHRAVSVASGEVSGGMMHIPSPYCPVHGDLFGQVARGIDRVGCMPCTAYKTWESQLRKFNPKMYAIIKLRKDHQYVMPLSELLEI